MVSARYDFFNHGGPLLFNRAIMKLTDKIEDRIKIFPIHTTQEHIKQIKQAVKLARVEYAELETKFKNKNQEALKLIKSITK